MKKILCIIVLLLTITGMEAASAKVIWDGAEIVEDQNGKMTFTKDVKVYKRLADGSFQSLVVKKGNYFRVYTIEQYNGQTFYWMSSGYRVQATNLVVFKEIPYEVKQHVMTEYYYVVTKRDGAQFLSRRSTTLGTAVHEAPYSFAFEGPAPSNGFVTQNFSEYYSCGEECDGLRSYQGFIPVEHVAQYKKEQSPLYKDFVLLTKDTPLIANLGTNEALQPISLQLTNFTAQQLNVLPKGTILPTSGVVINNHLQVALDGSLDNAAYYRGFVPLDAVTTLPKPTTYYTQRSVDLARSWDFMNYAALGAFVVPRHTAVQLYSSNGIFALVQYNGRYGYVPADALKRTKGEDHVITGTIGPAATYQYKLATAMDEYLGTFTSADGKQWTANGKFSVTYEDTPSVFRFTEHGNGTSKTYTLTKPIREGDKIANHGKIITILTSYTTPAGTFNNVIVTDYGYYIAPGYGIIQWSPQHYVESIVQH